MMVDMAMDAEAPMAEGGMAKSESAEEYSSTNVQVEGVDEADIVKNDGKYIYLLNQDRLLIVDAYPAQGAEVVFEDEIDGRPANMFVNGDRMAVFTVESDQELAIMPFDFMPRPRYVQKTHVLVYDFSDRSDPEVVQEYEITGNYFQSRMIGDYVYFVVQDSVYYHNRYIDLPAIREGGAVVLRPEIYYFGNPEDNYVFQTVASFNIEDDDQDMNAETYLMGYGNTLMVSEDNIYIAYQKHYSWRWYEDDREEKFYKVVVPLLPRGVQEQIDDIKDSNARDYEKWMQISDVLNEMYDSMEEDDAEELVEEIAESVEEYEIKQEMERRKTVIHRIAIDEGDIEYKGSGEVYGYLNNQFSLDEYDGNLRVATTVNIWRGGRLTHNNVYVMDEDMDVVGELEGIAPDETIYSTRFMGEKLYMVTFERIDPLFVIDLSDPRDPEILGELKIPGYSDYLHPYDEDHIIGIGKETAENKWGGVSIKGVKLALFDVSDVESPQMVDMYEIGDRGTDSEALRDHKAFLFDKDRNMLVLPIREVNEDRYYDKGYYWQDVWQGAYVFGVTPEDGFDVEAKISHQSGLEKYYYYYNGNAVRRSLYMDDVLYTISGNKILASDMDDWEEISEVELDWEEETYYWY
jgi:uncharacterized secreted protein with C-terminal beta-propeller domain